MVWAGFDDKLRREVAVKTLHGERFDIETRAHLLAEARILSQLDHGGICRVYDYLEGEDSDYLVLERIHGETLRKATERQSFNTAELLQIAQEIADALAVAHARGIVHRDLKPSNVMLTDGGESGHREVKVLDFGLAHSTHRPASLIGSFRAGSRTEHAAAPPTADGTLTRFASLLLDSDSGTVTGTPANMSPEQARGEPPTPASDLYSFGLLLQELFTGASAYPPGLSVDLLLVKAADGDTLPVQGIDRDVKALIEDLLELVPEKRPTAFEAAARLERIRRRPARRRRVVVTAALAILALVAGVKYTFDLQRERNLAFAARQEAQTVADFLTGLFEASDAWSVHDEELSVRGIVDRGAATIDRELADQPAVQARLLHTLGVVYSSLELYDEARPFLERALEMRRELHGDEHVGVADTLHELGILRMEVLDFDAAEIPLKEALAQRRLLLADHPDLAESLNVVGAWHAATGDWSRAEKYYHESLALWERLPDPSGEFGKIVFNLAGSLYNRGDSEEAVKALRRGLAAQRRLDLTYDPQLVLIIDRLASILAQIGQLDEAESLYHESTDLWRRIVGPGHGYVSLALSSQAMVLRFRGDLDAALALNRQAVEMSQRTGADTCRNVANQIELTKTLLDRGDSEEAETVLTGLQEIIAGCRYREAEVDLELGRLHRAQGELQRAEALFRRVLAIWKDYYPPGNPDSLRIESMIGEILSERGSPAAAEPLLLKSYEGLLGSLGISSPHTRIALTRLVAFYETRQPERAAEYRSHLLALEDQER